ncbi:MAG: gliding motility-associated C-terminal domain-containing protein [Crocinitomicaceae bacterium]|nr:gliding motility-associated C-terminal domain-containing protein [Crocinitomicaceae bacterium]
MKKLLIFGLFITLGISLNAQQNTNCADMDPICTDVGLNFQAQSNVPAASVQDPGNDYGCLFTSPNPTWYYFEISQSGLLDMQLFAPQDIDFIIWGPFADLTTAQSYCGQMGVAPGAPEVDCSYSATNNENPVIPNAQVGEVYVMLITNYANQVQNIDLTLNANSTGETDCSIVTPDPCVADAGTFVYKVNGQFIQGNTAVLCPDDDFQMISNLDYTLPNDTIPNPPGDGVWNAEMMYLIYDQEPVSLDPSSDPGFLGLQHIKVGNQHGETNAAGNYIFDNFGCGKYWLVPTPGDDGLTTGDVNGSAHYDKNNNGCYDLDTAAAFKLTLTCPITATSGLDCDGSLAGNGVSFTINGGLPAIEGGNYIVTNNGPGILSSNSTGVGGSVSVTNLSDGDVASIIVTDANGCSQTFTQAFSAPSYSVSITPGSTCGTTATNNGAISVTGSGTVAAYSITFTTPAIASAPSPASATSLFAGDAVSFLVEDGNGCVTQGDTTIGSTNHFILTNVTAEVAESCPGTCDGSATITAVPVDGSLNPDGAVITAITVDGNAVTIANPLNIANLCAGIHNVMFSDDFGCDVTVPISIGAPNPLIPLIQASNDPTCYGENDGSINTGVTGGQTPYTYSWSHDPTRNNSAAEFLTAGTYTMYVTDANGCTDSVTQVLDQPDSLWFELVIKDALCFGDSTGYAYVSQIHGAQGPTTIFWQTDKPNPTNTNPVSNLYAGSHTVQIFDDNACESEKQFQISNPAQLIIQTLSSQPSYCRGNGFYPGSGTVSGTASGGTGTLTYTWIGSTDTVNTNTVGNREPGWYHLYVTDQNGCIISDSVYVDSLNPVANFTATPMQGTQPVTVTVTDNSSDRVTNTWQYFSVNNGSSSNSFIIGYDSLQPPFDTTFVNDDEYAICLIVANDFECYDTLCKNITVFPVPNIETPNVFTPNNDGENDLFFFPSDGLSELNATFLNRWGNKVYEFTSPTDQWDGTNMTTGQPCSDGVYSFVYTAKAQNGTEFSGQGFVHLISKP